METETPTRPVTRAARSTRHRYHVFFPPEQMELRDQDEVFFNLAREGAERTIRFHDYAEIYRHPGLYEQLFYDRLKCQSPQKVAEILSAAVRQSGEHLSELRVLDLGAGNGMAAEALNGSGVARLVGVDIIQEAADAADRDRPGVYDQYYVADMCDLGEGEHAELESWSFDCLLSVAALGFGDIPPKAFLQALNLIRPDGWVAFNIKETFLDGSDESGFSRMIRHLVLSEHLDLYHLERYRHRLSIEGTPLYYFALVARKSTARLPLDPAAFTD